MQGKKSVFSLKGEKRIAAHLTAVSPADSVGASASRRCPPDTRTAMTERQVTAHPVTLAATNRLVILNARAKESVFPLRENGLPQPLTRLRNDEGDGKRIATRLTAVSPAGSVGASASQRCPPDTRTAMTAFLYAQNRGCNNAATVLLFVPIFFIKRSKGYCRKNMLFFYNFTAFKVGNGSCNL